MITSFPELLETLKGVQIVDGGTDTVFGGDGMHFTLSDGRVFVIVGEFNFYVGTLNPRSLQ